MTSGLVKGRDVGEGAVGDERADAEADDGVEPELR